VSDTRLNDDELTATLKQTAESVTDVTNDEGNYNARFEAGFVDAMSPRDGKPSNVLFHSVENNLKWRYVQILDGPK
jgi:hypothetical protein